MNMKACARRLLFSATIALGTVQAAQADFIGYFTDTLTSDAGQIVATDPWAAGTSFTYNVTEGTDGDAGMWKYEYRLEVLDKAISHLIIEVSDSFLIDNTFQGTTDGGEVDTYTDVGPGNSNPGLPSDVYGIKWDTTGDPTLFEVVIISDRAPIWGDFYAKDGVFGTPPDRGDVYGYNAGFTNPDTDPVFTLASLGQNPDHILVPDTTGGVPPGTIPEPGALVLLGTGLLGLATTRRRRRSRQQIRGASD